MFVHQAAVTGEFTDSACRPWLLTRVSALFVALQAGLFNKVLFNISHLLVALPLRNPPHSGFASGNPTTFTQNRPSLQIKYELLIETVYLSVLTPLPLPSVCLSARLHHSSAVITRPYFTITASVHP